MLYEEWKSRYKNLKNFNTVLQRCPRFWPLAPPRGMNPGVYSLGISEDPPRYLSSKFDASVRSDCWDISIWKTLTQCDGNGNANANSNADDRGDYNSSPCTSYMRAKNISGISRTRVKIAELIQLTTNWWFFLLFPGHGLWQCMQNVSLWVNLHKMSKPIFEDNLHKMSKPIFLKKKKRKKREPDCAVDRTLWQIPTLPPLRAEGSEK